MKRVGIGSFAAVFAFGFALSAYACDKEKSGCGKAATLAAAKVTAEAEKAGGCSKGGKAEEAAVARAMKMLPQMTYKVGDLETPCCYTAKKASEASGSAILYMVGDDGYSCKKTAMDKLAEKMKADMPKLAQVVSSVDGEQVHCFIQASAIASEKNTKVKYLLAGVEFDCRDSAGAVAAKVTEKLKAEGIACDGKAVTASAYCSKTSDASCCATAKTASASGCGSKEKDAKTASASDGCCPKSKAAAVAAASSGGCDKSKAEAATASATEGGCSKSKAEAATASATEGGCSKSKAATASAGGCDKSKAEAATASATEGGCSKSKAAAATASAGGCSKSKAEGAVATVAGDKATIAEHFAADPAAAEALEETEELARAKQMVRQIVDFVSTQKAS